MAMVTDSLIGILLLLSAAINILALGAFIVTPSLRSTSNRFVINLLIVNVIGCLILAPSLLFNSNVIRNLYSYSEEETNNAITPTTTTTTTSAISFSTTVDAVSSKDLSQTIRNAFNKSSSKFRWLSPEQMLHVEPLYHGGEAAINSTTVYKINHQLSDDAVEIASDHPGRSGNKIDVGDDGATEDDTPFHQIRPWILDIIAAIGALSLLLVVGDTYCAVTDPLRYHSRISASRVCCLIVLVWCIALAFGVSSALRMSCVNDILSQSSVYNTVFGSTYFVCIILIPFSLVGAMYWGIIREARKNGLRLRHNGSSPLLQSVLHIGPGQHHGSPCHAVQELQPHADEVTPEKFRGSTRDHLSCTSARTNCKSIHSSNNRQQQRQKSSSQSLGGGGGGAGIKASLRRNKSAQHLMGPTLSGLPTCECSQQILITRSISNQSAYLNSAQHYHLKVPNGDLLRTARSSPELYQNLLLAEQGTAALQHIRSPVRPTKTLGYMTSIRHRLSNASSLFKYREESRAARISILVVIMFLTSYIPFGLLVLAEGHDSFLSTYQQTVLAIFFVVLANIISPLIFAYRNKRVRRGIHRLVSGHGRTSCANSRERNRSVGDNNNQHSVKEVSERNGKKSAKVMKLTRHKSVDLPKKGTGGALSLFHESTDLPRTGPRRKLVIFNGRNGQITSVCQPEHHKNFLQLKDGICGNITGCNKDQLVTHKEDCPLISRKNSLAEMGCLASNRSTRPGKVTRAIQRARMKSPTSPKDMQASEKKPDEEEKEVFLNRIRYSSAQIFKRPMMVRSLVPQVNIDFPSTMPINV